MSDAVTGAIDPAPRPALEAAIEYDSADCRNW